MNLLVGCRAFWHCHGVKHDGVILKVAPSSSGTMYAWLLEPDGSIQGEKVRS